MFPFAFQHQPIEQPKPDELSLLQALFMNILENQRLRHKLDTMPSQDISFSVEKKDFNRDHQYKLELELKQVKIENLNSIVRELQNQIMNSDKQRQEVLQRTSQVELVLKQELAETRSQMNYYKGKFEEEANNSKRYNSKLQTQIKSLKSQMESKSKEVLNKAAQIQVQRTKYEKNLEEQTLQNEKRIKQLRVCNETLRNDLSLKEQECFSLKASLNDCPKLQELNRWINKVKEYEERQIQACGKMSQMSQQICVSRERYRKLEGEYRQLQKIKQQLQNALTENKGNEDSMVLYFDRLETYEKVIKQLEQEIRKLEAAAKTKDKEHQSKIQALEREKENIVTQWKSIAEQMEKQKVILSSLQKQVEKYQKYVAEQNERQHEMIRERQMNQLNFQIKAAENQRNKAQLSQHHPYSFIEQKGIQKQNRSLSLQSRNQLKSSQIQTQSNKILQSHVTYDPPSRQLRLNSSMIRPSSQQRIIYHSDPHSRNSTSRLNTQASNTSSRQTGCEQCISRIHQTRDYSNRSMNMQENRHLRSEECRVDMSQVTDQKKLLMDKLNVLKPQDTNTSVRGLDRNISNLYSKNYRQVNPSSQSTLKLNNAHSSKQIIFNNANRLQLGRGKPQLKQNLNDMIVKRYTNLLQRP